ncbi:hypothetical protein EO98_14705 [Methanosarcina sp. 2.H.T.1A.6]|nr:hypothetical protein EO94_00950 [Methanosarcina sp. 2.H.T.1A.3]KKG22766.1 hypothetical protein EO98_14705 [Methanosarcina sp. 2.H.T.1A.6]KKG22936.1 hypothetical protein EO97_18620 [Methanosarcina sp. 2.H.T.1A.15]KKG24503.1 hypothetical protein EO96_15165 [Methanosarcina sp. 2.H.T.1A.8]
MVWVLRREIQIKRKISGKNNQGKNNQGKNNQGKYLQRKNINRGLNQWKSKQALNHEAAHES